MDKQFEKANFVVENETTLVSEQSEQKAEISTS